MDRDQLQHIFHETMLMSRTAFAGGEFDVTYHLLMAALHSAQSLGNIALLREVEELATEVLQDIDKHHPEYGHSTASASVRHQASIFAVAARQANARILILERKGATR